MSASFHKVHACLLKDLGDIFEKKISSIYMYTAKIAWNEF